jgi:3'(2'), 5'-bisphosphate nucleotidase
MPLLAAEPSLNPAILNDVCSLARSAGEVIMQIYRSGDWTVSEKADHSPLTQADLASHSVIAAGLQKLTPQIPVVSEEGDPHAVQKGNRYWLVDPLDGTRDFVARLDTFVVCIGLIEDGYPTAGVIYSPVLAQAWWAQRGQGAFTDSGPIFHSSQRTNLIAAGSRSMPSTNMQLLYENFAVTEVKRYGSALKFCRLAEGDVDLYPRFGPTSEWDTAAGQAIAEEAGCKVIDLATGERLAYGKKNLLNGSGFVASKSGLMLYEMLEKNNLLKTDFKRP